MESDTDVEKKKTARIAILVVHGVGEQRRFEYLESVATHLYQVLSRQGRDPHVALRFGDQDPRNSPEHSLRESPAMVRWRAPDGRSIEAVFREVHWADLDMPQTAWNWLKLVGWSLSVPGVRLFRRARVGPPEKRGLCAPVTLGFWKRLWVRAELFLVALLFLILLGTVGLADVLLRRLALRLPVFARTRDLVYDYLGDVKLYQDWFPRKEERLEVIGEKSRVAIRRRMVRALLRTAAEAERGEIDGFYVLAHSLGTVVAFNGLMEPDLSLPNYLTQEEWNGLPSAFKKTVNRTLPKWLTPRRPPWLDAGAVPAQADAVLPRDTIPRQNVFAALRGVLTMGSPLDKFAALWPAIVPVHVAGLGREVPWINIADVQDIVAGKIDLLKPCPPSPNLGGLVLQHNIRWSDRLFFGNAHTSYWRVTSRRDRLIDRLVPWLEGQAFDPPRNARPGWLSWTVFVGSVLASGAFLLWAFTSLVWLIAVGAKALSSTSGVMQAMETLLAPAGGLQEYTRTIFLGMGAFLAVGALIVLVFSLGRWLWENAKFGRES